MVAYRRTVNVRPQIIEYEHRNRWLVPAPRLVYTGSSYEKAVKISPCPKMKNMTNWAHPNVSFDNHTHFKGRTISLLAVMSILRVLVLFLLDLWDNPTSNLLAIVTVVTVISQGWDVLYWIVIIPYRCCNKLQPTTINGTIVVSRK